MEFWVLIAVGYLVIGCVVALAVKKYLDEPKFDFKANLIVALTWPLILLLHIYLLWRYR